MKNFVLSCLDKTDQTYIDCLEMFISEADNYQNNLKVLNVLKDDERDYFEFLISCYQNSGKTPSEDLFKAKFSLKADNFAGCKIIAINDIRVYMFQLIDARVNVYIHDRLKELNELVKEHGITQEITEEFDRLQKLSNRNKAKDIDIDINSKDIYEEMKSRPLGMITGIKAIDDKIGGMNPGTITTIAGFTSQYKTTFAVNIARINALSGYNIAYISLETPKTDMNWNLLSSHSYNPKFTKCHFIPHDRMRKCILTPDEESYLFDVIEPDLKGNMYNLDGTPRLDEKGNPIPKGRVIFLDEGDFDNFSFGEISAVLEKVDDKLDGKLDAVIVDYIQLCKFSGSGLSYDANSQINSYITFFRRLGQNFRKQVDANGNEIVRSLIVILLSQIRRDSWRKAANNNGRYDLTCLSDANELERGSYRVFTTFTSEEMKGRKAAQVQILKNRTGQTMYEPAPVSADGEAYIFEDEDNTQQTFGGQSMDLNNAFAALDDDLGFLGID